MAISTNKDISFPKRMQGTGEAKISAGTGPKLRENHLISAGRVLALGFQKGLVRKAERTAPPISRATSAMDP
jgi:hypothetical protein